MYTVPISTRSDFLTLAPQPTKGLHYVMHIMRSTPNPFLCPSCPPERVGVDKKGVN